MIGAFPAREGWITLHLALADDKQLVLLELAGACPGVPIAHPIRASPCASQHHAHCRAVARLAAGWAVHSAADRPAGATSAAAAVRAPAWNPSPGVSDRALPAGEALAAVAHTITAAPEPYCLFPNPTARR
jgi:hypothetical protein